jgi:hypothetical protein
MKTEGRRDYYPKNLQPHGSPKLRDICMESVHKCDPWRCLTWIEPSTVQGIVKKIPLPVDFIEAERSANILPKKKMLDIHGGRYFKTRADGLHSTRLVSREGVYSWVAGTTEDNKKLLEKAGLMPHKNCTPFLANTSANCNSKVDTVLQFANSLDICIENKAQPSKARVW